MEIVTKVRAALAQNVRATKALYERYEKWAPAGAFLAGTIYDVLTLGRIDQLFNLLQLAFYLLLVALLLAAEIYTWNRPVPHLPRLLRRLWPFRDEATHFLLGSLLSAFTLFYLKSSSILGSLVFYLVIAGCLVGNEFGALRRRGPVIRTLLFTVCLASYVACLVPLVWGRVGPLPFATSIAITAVIGGVMLWILRGVAADDRLLARRVGIPMFATLGMFLMFYLLHIIPPVPIALTDIGIYRSVDRVPGGYRVTYERPDWKFWQRGDQTFRWREGERVYCFFSVFSPGGFKDQVQVRWLYDDPEHGWGSSDAVPVPITGGREQGYRGFAFKQRLRLGSWQIRVETNDGREIGRIRLRVVPDEDQAPRNLKEVFL